jgi:hypothetical protein
MALEPGDPAHAADSDEIDAETASDETASAETTSDETTSDETASDETAPPETPVADTPVTGPRTAARPLVPEARPPVTAPVFTPRAETQAPAGTLPGSLDGPEDGPLLPDADELRTNWQRVQASFVDDPHTAVAEAADLVGHVVQALTGALRQRQERLREQWVTDGADPGAGPGTGPDTERLRVTLQQYRAVFNQICRD